MAFIDIKTEKFEWKVLRKQISNHIVSKLTTTAEPFQVY